MFWHLILALPLTPFFFHRGPEIRFAVLGLYKVDQAGKEDGTEVIEIHEQYPNPLFNWDTAVYDQMLILLARPASNNWPVVKMNFNPTIPSQQQNNGGNNNSNKITVIGNGVIDRNTHFPTVLQKLTVDYLPNEQCKALPGMWQVDSDMVCVIGDGTTDDQSQCSGDSGGPYLLLGDSYKTDLLIATVSWYVLNMDNFCVVFVRIVAAHYWSILL